MTCSHSPAEMGLLHILLPAVGEPRTIEPKTALLHQSGRDSSHSYLQALDYEPRPNE